MGHEPPMVGSLFSWKSLLTKRNTREDCDGQSDGTARQGWLRIRTLPTAASPRSTSLTLLLGFGALPESVMLEGRMGSVESESDGGPEEKETRRPGDVVLLCDFLLGALGFEAWVWWIKRRAGRRVWGFDG